MSERRKILFISPEFILPPQTGGSIRSTQIMLGLARHYKVTTLVPHKRSDVELALKNFPELDAVDWTSMVDHPAYRMNSLKSKLRMHARNWLQRKAEQRWRGVFGGWFFAPLYTWHPILEYLKDKSYFPDVVVIEHTRHAATLLHAKKLWPEALVVCNSQNVESEIIRQQAAGGPNEKAFYSKLVEKIERSVLSRLDILWTCSKDDEEKYRRLGIAPRHFGIVPNGVDTAKVGYTAQKTQHLEPVVLFSGTLCYKPNVDGVKWFCEAVWPLVLKSLPSAKLQIVGRMPSGEVYELSKKSASVSVIADVPSLQTYLDRSSVGICPLFSGSGTRLKILEAFAAGLPMVSTRLGAEGISAENSTHILIADEAEQFANSVVEILQNPEAANSLRSNARKLAEGKYDWNVITEGAAIQLQKIALKA